MNEPINNTAHFTKDGVKYMLALVSDKEMIAIRTDQETGIQRNIEGYPMYWTLAGELYPHPVKGIEVVYD